MTVMLLKKRVDDSSYCLLVGMRILLVYQIYGLFWAFPDHIHLRLLTLLRPMEFSIKIDFCHSNSAEPDERRHFSWVFAICQTVPV